MKQPVSAGCTATLSTQCPGTPETQGGLVVGTVQHGQKGLAGAVGMGFKEPGADSLHLQTPICGQGDPPQSHIQGLSAKEKPWGSITDA